MTHPLTDEIIEQNFTPEYGYVESDSILGVSQVDCGFNCDDLRAAADWQLEQVTNWLKATKSTVKLCPSLLADQIEVAMRPQQQQEDTP